MPDPQRLMKQGLLKEKQDELKRLVDEAENYLTALSVATFVQDSPLDLDAGNITAATNGLCAVIRQAAIVRNRINELEEELGL